MSPTESFWCRVHAGLLGEAPGTTRSFDKREAPHPRDAGATLSFGLPKGQIRDWRFPPDAACRGLHVHEFAERFVAHVDRVHPDCDPVDHAAVDAPELFVIGGMALGALLGFAIAERKEGAIVGGGLGLLAGIASAALVSGAVKKKREA